MSAPKWYRSFGVLLKNYFKCFLNDDKVGNIFINSALFTSIFLIDHFNVPVKVVVCSSFSLVDFMSGRPTSLFFDNVDRVLEDSISRITSSIS